MHGYKTLVESTAGVETIYSQHRPPYGDWQVIELPEDLADLFTNPGTRDDGDGRPLHCVWVDQGGFVTSCTYQYRFWDTCTDHVLERFDRARARIIGRKVI